MNMKRRNVLTAVCATALITMSCCHRHDANQAMNGDDDGEIVTLVAVEEVSIDSTLTDSAAATPTAPAATAPTASPTDTAHATASPR